jgi:phosphatidylserine decarboxylase
LPVLLQTYDINAEEAEKPVAEYKTLQDFFARRLRPELRPTAEPE